METSHEEVSTNVAPVEAKSAALPSLAAFRALFDAELAYVCRALRRLGVQQGDIEDVAQELFVTIHRDFAEYDPSQPLRPWLFSYALRFAANHRRLARNRGHVSDTVLAGASRGADQQAEARDTVLRGLSQLDFDFRTVIVMHDLEGFDAPEIAAQLGVPVNTVYSRLRRARAEFRAVIEAREGVREKGDAS